MTAPARTGGAPRRPRIAVYAIARDEAPRVERWATSARDADQVVLVDTGSSDGTPDVARRLDVVVHEIEVEPFRFDVARNQALGLVAADVDLCIPLDLDEVLAPGWRRCIEEIWRPDVTRVTFARTWSWNPTQPAHHYRDDRIHARQGHRWIRPVHEVPVASTAEVVAHSDVRIDHHRDPGAPRPQYLDLLRLAIEEDPTDGRLAHMLANEHRLRGAPAEARAWAHRALELSLPVDETAHALLMLSWLEPAEREERLVSACRVAPDRREPWCELARLQLERGHARAALGAVRAALAVGTAAEHYLENPAAWAHLPHVQGAAAAEQLGDLDAAVRFARAAARAAPLDGAVQALLHRLVGRLSSADVPVPEPRASALPTAARRGLQP